MIGVPIVLGRHGWGGSPSRTSSALFTKIVTPIDRIQGMRNGSPTKEESDFGTCHQRIHSNDKECEGKRGARRETVARPTARCNVRKAPPWGEVKTHKNWELHGRDYPKHDKQSVPTTL